MLRILIIFAIVQLINVILNTIKTIVTANGNKLVATLVNAVTYGFYTIVVVMTASDEMSLGWKVGLTIVTNLIGVYFSMWLLEKIRKDKLWEIKATVKRQINDDTTQNNIYYLEDELVKADLSFNNFWINDNEMVFHIYSHSQKESAIIKPLLKKYNAKYIVHEEKAKL